MHWLVVILILPYLILLFNIYRGLLKIKRFSLSADPSTFVTIIVACRNEQEKISRLIRSIITQDYPKELYEVIIVDDHSTDLTYEIASGFASTGIIHTIYNSGKGKKTAIRTGVEASSGNLMITTDADCIVGSLWIKTIASFFEKNYPDMIIAPVQILPEKGVFGVFQELEFLSLQGITAGSALNMKGIMCNGANLAFKREIYDSHKDNLHMEITSGDDVFLLHSLKKTSGSKILWLESTEAVVKTDAVLTQYAYLKQRKRWISKSLKYTDINTITLGIVTLVTNLLQATLFVSGLINTTYISVFFLFLLLKSIPDFLILRNTTGRYGRRDLLKWFLPAQIFYPFYVIIVVVYAISSGIKRNF
jgi:cellulose synthase/poly-beta-1,6-N-acetylglucosamine synthase-like glycosyltransferase